MGIVFSVHAAIHRKIVVDEAFSFDRLVDIALFHLKINGKTQSVPRSRLTRLHSPFRRLESNF